MIQFEYKPSRDRTRWCQLTTIAGNTPHCLVNSEWNVNIFRDWKHSLLCSVNTEIVAGWILESGFTEYHFILVLKSNKTSQSNLFPVH